MLHLSTDFLVCVKKGKKGRKEEGDLTVLDLNRGQKKKSKVDRERKERMNRDTLNRGQISKRREKNTKKAESVCLSVCLSGSEARNVINIYQTL